MDMSTADIHDAYEGRVAVCELQFRSFGRRMRFAGPAVTLKVHEDHRRVKDAVSGPGNGQVLVVDAGGSLRVGVLGDLLAGLAVKNGWAGVVINGAIRDSDAIDALDIGVKALGATARRGNTDLGGARDLPVAFGGTDIHPGDWIYADRDSVLISRERLPC
jgi:regulator of ribonuclease activity A